MTPRVVYRKAAQAEIDEAILYYERQRTGIDEDLLNEIDQAVMRAAAHINAATSMIAKRDIDFSSQV